MRSDSDAPDDGMVVEWAPFRLAPGAEEAALLEASEILQRDFLQRQPGFVRRELLRGADGQWVDLVVWRDKPSAMLALSAAGSSAACHAYFHLMVGGDTMDASTGVLHLHLVRDY
jgi:hypothetical protein